MHLRSIAASNGEKTYFTGMPCVNGHVARRDTRSGSCLDCRAELNSWYLPQWRQRNANRVKELNRASYERDPGYSIRNRRKRWSEVYARRRADPDKWLGHSLRAAICIQLRRGNAAKVSTTTTLLGCSIPEFREHIERQWSEGMSWANWGRKKGCWQLDHKRPIASFDLTDPAQQLQCFNFRNYQPLWAEDNIRKGARWGE